MAKKGIMYRILPFNGLWTNRDVSEVVNGMMNGKINATGEVDNYKWYYSNINR